MELFFQILLLVIGIIFLVLYVFRVLQLNKVEISAVITNIEEASEAVQDLYSPITYCYPCLRFEYEYDDKTYTGEIGKQDFRKFRIEKLSQWGDERPNQDFPWRTMVVGDQIRLVIDGRSPEKGVPVTLLCPKYRSETTVFIVVAILFIACAATAHFALR